MGITVHSSVPSIWSTVFHSSCTRCWIPCNNPE